MNGPAATRTFRVHTTGGPVPVVVCQMCAALLLADGERSHDLTHRAALRGDDQEDRRTGRWVPNVRPRFPRLAQPPED